MKPEEEEGRSSRPTPTSSKAKAGGKGEGLEERVEEHSISTRPDVRRPLFDEELAQGFNDLPTGSLPLQQIQNSEDLDVLAASGIP